MLSKEEIEKAKKFINNIKQTIQENNMFFGEENIITKPGKTTVQNLDTLLKYIDQLESDNYELNNRLNEYIEDNKKQTKMIDEMIKQLTTLALWDNKNERVILLETKQDIKKYFEEKVEEENEQYTSNK